MGYPGAREGWYGGARAHRAPYPAGMPWEDDDDWVGEPPEGRHTRDRANPGFWATQRPVSYTAAAIGIVVIVLLLVLLLG